MLAAEGRKEAAFRDAEARERSREAEAKATEMVSEAIAKGNVQAINYFVANNYVKALEAIAKSPNQKILMMPLEASAVIGSLAGLAEITRRGIQQERRGRPSGAVRLAARARAACRRPEIARSAVRRRWGERHMQGLFAYFCGFGVWNWFILARGAVHPGDDGAGRALPVVRRWPPSSSASWRWPPAWPGRARSSPSA